MDTKRKLVIIGSGPAAFTAAIYAARAELKPLVLAGEQPGGQLMLTTKVENYPGFADGVMGQDLMAAMRQQAERQGVTVIDKEATAIEKDGDIFIIGFGLPDTGQADKKIHRLTDNPIIHSSANPIVRSSAVILATGAQAVTLKLPGEDRLMGRGVGTCAVCDAPFYRGKDTVFIIGGGDSAIEEASEISKFASKVIILVRKESLRATPILTKRIEAIQNVEIWYKSQALELLGDKRLEKVKVNKDGTIAEFPADGLFYAIGHKPATGWLKGSGVELDKNGYIITIDDQTNRQIDEQTNRQVDKQRNRQMDNPTVRSSDNQIIDSSDSPIIRPSTFPTMTSISGIFAAGDCVDFRYRQAIVAAGQGCMAALDAQKWLENTGD